MSQYEQVPGSSATQLYVNGLELNPTFPTTTSFTLYSGVARDSTNIMDIVAPNNLTASLSSTGVNGLDTGTVAASSVYAVYLIGDITNANPAALVVSLNFTQPVLPSGYGYFRRVAVVVTTSGSVLAGIYQTGYGFGCNSTTRTYLYSNKLQVLTAGTSTTNANVSLASAVPALDAVQTIITAGITPNTAGNTLTIYSPYNATATNPPIIVHGQVSTIPQSAQYTIGGVVNVSGVPQIIYKVTSGSDAANIFVDGFVDQL